MKFFLARRGKALRRMSILALAISVCGGANAAIAASALPDEAAIKASAPASATFVYAVPSVTTTLDYQPYQGDANRFVDIPLESKLVLYDPTSLAGKGCEQLASVTDLKGDLATEWSYSDDRKTITFKLREAKSEYGNELTSADVKWSLDRTMALSPIAKFNYFTIADYRKTDPVTVVDDRTVQIHVNSPTALDVIENLVFFAIIYDSTEAKKHTTADDVWATAWLKDHTANFGPWKIAEFTPGQEVTYAPNANYYGERGNITKFILRSVPDASTRRQLLEAGAVDWAARLSLNDYKSLEASAGVTVRECQSPNRDNLVLNLKNKILANPQVREAISLALDREAIVKGAYLGFGQPAKSGLSAYYTYPAPAATYTFDVDKAKQVLAEAGYKDGFDLKLLYSPTRPGPMAEQSAILMRSMLAKIGIKVTLEQVASGTDFSDRFLKGQYDAIVWQEPPLIADPYFSAAIYNLSGSFQNSFGFNDPAYDQLVREVATTPPGDARNQKMSELASLGVTDYPVIYLVDDVFLQAHRSNIAGYVARPDGEVYPSELIKGK
jgi:peptide/nickel transport system substrate-binding protein